MKKPTFLSLIDGKKEKVVRKVVYKLSDPVLFISSSRYVQAKGVNAVVPLGHKRKKRESVKECLIRCFIPCVLIRSSAESEKQKTNGKQRDENRRPKIIEKIKMIKTK